MVMKQFIHETQEDMKKAVESTKREFLEVRSGRANPKLVEGIRVNYYGTPTLIKDIATISIPEARLLIVNPWDPNSIKEIEKAILQSEIGITPIVDGKIIRLIVPPLSEERREELIKLVKKTAEEGKVSLRTVRKNAKDKIKGLEKEKKVSEDEKFKLEQEVQELTGRYTKEIDKLLEDKEQELREF
jgi:ribosome recycling factor